MRTKDALEGGLTTAISAALPGSPLENAYLFGTPRGSVEAAEKVIRIEILAGALTRVSDNVRKEQGVTFKVQCFSLPTEAGNLEAEDAAIVLAFEMVEAVFNYLHSNPTLSGAVQDLDIPENEVNFETGMASFAGARYGAANLYGLINPY